MTAAGMLAPPAVACRGLVCAFGAVRAVDGVSFEVAQGEVFGLLGPNGAGKTTTIRALTTLLKPVAGTVEVFGLDTRRSAMRVRRRIGYVPRQLSIDGQLTGYENVWLFATARDPPWRRRNADDRHSPAGPAAQPLASCAFPA
jgi:ABC-2 type transport system ATP-binding protein